MHEKLSGRFLDMIVIRSMNRHFEKGNGILGWKIMKEKNDSNMSAITADLLLT